MTVDANDILAESMRPIEKALEKYNITPERLAVKLSAELEAKETKFFAFQGKVLETREVDALHIQQRAREDAHRLLNHYPAEKHEHHGNITVEVVNFGEPDPEG